ncbi:MAG: hypothetical protein P8Y10_15245 [Gemmatimonadales bacterium]
MGSAGGSSIKTSLREVVLVVVGVLLAFGVESRWSDYQEGRQDAGYLGALAAELQGDRAELEGVLRTARVASAAVDTIRMVSHGEIEVAPARIPHLFWRATSVGQIEITSTSLESLFTSPAWARIGDPELQLAITRHDQSLRELQSANERVTDYWFRAFEPVLRERIDYDGWEAGFRRPDELLASEDVADWVRLLEDREVRNLLTHTGWLAGEAERRVTDLRSEIDVIVERIRSPQ